MDRAYREFLDRVRRVDIVFVLLHPHTVERGYHMEAGIFQKPVFQATLYHHQESNFDLKGFYRWWAVVVLIWGYGVPRRRGSHVELAPKRAP